MNQPNRNPRITIIRQDPGGDFAASTLRLLLPQELEPDFHGGNDAFLVGATKIVLANSRPWGLGTIFANPRGSVRRSEPSRDFFQAAYNSQQGWLRSMRNLFGTRHPDRIAKQTRHQPLLWQLQFTGIMIVDGKHVFPNEWTKSIHQSHRR